MLNHWSMELSDNTLILAQFKDSSNILADAISRLNTLDVYRDPLENPKTSDTMMGGHNQNTNPTY